VHTKSFAILPNATALVLAAMCIAGTLVAPSALRCQESIAPFCSELRQVVAIATTKERFSSIVGKSREGNFSEARLVLTGWSDCSLYGAGTYTCDSRHFQTAQEAEQQQARMLQNIQACLGEGWVEAKDRSSARYAVLQHAKHPISITLSTDQIDEKQHVVRLILFVRRS
jgi:hypothetical protein